MAVLLLLFVDRPLGGRAISPRKECRAYPQQLHAEAAAVQQMQHDVMVKGGDDSRR
jgi:hypothetical protein